MASSAGSAGGAEQTRTCSFVMEGGLLLARFLAGVDVAVEDARANIALTGRLTGGRRAPILVDLRSVRSQSADARAYLAGPEATKVSLAVALLVKSPLSRAIGNFYLGFNRPEVPTRLFNDEALAREWLGAFLAEAAK